MLARRRQVGATLIELMIGIGVFAMLIALAVPMANDYIQNAHVRTAAESIVSGMQFAKSEALKRNSAVRFQLVNDLTGGCNLAANGESWVVSLADPTGNCAAAPSETVAPFILERRNAAEGSASADVIASSTPAAGGNNSTLIYNGLGRIALTNPNRFDRLRITNSLGSCRPGGSIRCLDIIITAGGDGRVCDPSITVSTDSRFC